MSRQIFHQRDTEHRKSYSHDTEPRGKTTTDDTETREKATNESENYTRQLLPAVEGSGTVLQGKHEPIGPPPAPDAEWRNRLVQCVSTG